MRVLFVSYKFPPQKGGVGVSAFRIASGLATWCEQVDVLHATREMDPGLVNSRELGSLTVFTTGETDRRAESSQLLETTIRALHQQRRYQLIIGFYAVPSGLVAIFTAKYLGLPSLLCLRGNDLDRAIYHEGQLASLLWAAKNATAVAGVSRELVQKVDVLTGRKDGHFVANSVDSKQFYPEDIQPIARSLVFTGEMRLKKGSEILFPALLELEGDWSLTLAGGFRGRAESAFRRWSLENSLASKRVQTIPYERDTARLRRLLNQADLVINPALWDGMPNSVLEAMACGRPVLSTKVGGVSDLVEDGVTGFLVELADLGNLSEAIERALSHPKRREIGLAAREKVLKDHSQELEISAYREILESLKI